MVRFIRYAKIFRLYEHIQPYLKYSLPLEAKLPGTRALVVAPHPDDETIGCGGTLSLHTAAGGSAGAVFCASDGGVRDAEAAAAARELGIGETVFLNYAVGSLGAAASLPARLCEVFEKKEPEIVFVPFVIDNHADHRAVNEALVRVRKLKRFDFIVYAYPVWFPLYPNVLVDIGAAWPAKEKAIRCYASQLATRDYVAMSRSLGQYWAKVKGRELEVVETFFRASFDEYAALAGKML